MYAIRSYYAFFLKESLPPGHRKPWREAGKGSRSPLAAVSHSPVLLGVVAAVFLRNNFV